MSVSRIMIYIMKPLAKVVIDAMHEIGINDYVHLLGNAPILEVKTHQGFLAKLFSGSDIMDDPSEAISFTVPTDSEESVMNYLIEKGQLQLPGRGSIYSETIETPKSNEHCVVNQPKEIKSEPREVLKDLTEICCIVQRGQSEAIARTVLNMGIGTPHITFGTGTGVRDKMGLLRITIPAEKEILWVATSRHDADMAMDTMIEVGELDLPGKGFIYSYPLGRGVLNMRMTCGSQRAAASIEQIVAAVDEIKNGVEWRRSADLKTNLDEHNYLRDLIDMTLVCDEGGADELIKIAMESGAAGATTIKVKHSSPEGESGASISKSRERSTLIISPQQSEDIIANLEKVGAFTDKYHGKIILRKVDKAFTYLGK